MSERGTDDSKYVLVMPTRDEEKYLQAALDSIAAQTELPAELVIVNDGSKDRTGEIAEAAARKYPWIHVVHRADRGERKVGGGVVDTFYSGYEALRTTDYTFICKIDGDLTFGPAYFEELLKKFAAEPRLGGASGKVFNPVNGVLHAESLIDEMVAGLINFWRRECFEDFGGFVREVMWDGINFHRARMFGWRTASFHDEALKIVHHRLMGSSHKGILHGRMRWGRGQWFMGTHPLYVIASGIFRMRERPYVVGGLCIVAGYFRAWLQGERRYDDLRFRNELHRWQLRRLGLGFLAPK